MDYSSYMRQHLPFKVQKISINAGFTCPNRDGKVSFGGCTYCNNHSFNPDYCSTVASIREQLEQGKLFFQRKAKYADLKYLAYFQAFTNTYAPLSHLKLLYEEALSVDNVVGLVIATRPDCLPIEVLDYLAELSHRTFVMLEIGIESTLDATLSTINRGHNFLSAATAVKEAAERGIHTAAHLILGLPGETRDDMLSHADRLSTLPIEVLKLHQLQIVKGTKMAMQYADNPSFVHLFTPDEYIELICEFLPRLRSDIVVERFTSSSPKEILIAPDWGLKNYEFVAKLEHRLAGLGIKR